MKNNTEDQDKLKQLEKENSELKKTQKSLQAEIKALQENQKKLKEDTKTVKAENETLHQDKTKLEKQLKEAKSQTASSHEDTGNSSSNTYKSDEATTADTAEGCNIKGSKTASTTRRAVHTMTGQPTRLKCFVQLKKLKPPATGRQNDKQKAPESLELLLFHNDDLITFL